MDSAIVIKTIQKDVADVQPLAANVVVLQQRLLEAVQRYQHLIGRSVVDAVAVQNLLEEISMINGLQKIELDQVREAETAVKRNQKEETPREAEESSSQVTIDVPEAAPVIEEEEEVGYLSFLDLVHVNRFKEAEERLAQRKLSERDGKKIYSPGPWQMLDPPTKVFLRSKSHSECQEILPFYVTVRPKNPLQRLNEFLCGSPASPNKSSVNIYVGPVRKSKRART